MQKIDEIKADIEYWKSRTDLRDDIREQRVFERERDLVTALRDGIPLDLLESTCDAIRAGRCVVQPVKSHTFVFWIDEDGKIHDRDKYLTSIWQDMRLVHLIYNGATPYEYRLVSEFFLTREAALAAQEGKQQMTEEGAKRALDALGWFAQEGEGK